LGGYAGGYLAEQSLVAFSLCEKGPDDPAGLNADSVLESVTGDPNYKALVKRELAAKKRLADLKRKASGRPSSSSSSSSKKSSKKSSRKKSSRKRAKRVTPFNHLFVLFASLNSSLAKR
jgi:hypothetical protein